MTGGKGVDVGYMAHPSFVDADEVKALTGPLSIAAAGEFKAIRIGLRLVTDCRDRNRSDLPC